MDRRTFLKIIGTGIAGSTAGNLMTPGKSSAADSASGPEFYGILVDTTRCIGCRRCELACAEVNGLPKPDISETANETVFKSPRQLTETQYTVTGSFTTEKGTIFVPRRCMHCNQPGCVAACPVKAMKKRPSGHVTWDSDCIGCRLCMVSCPFDVPKFEYGKAVPNIQKCNLCWERFTQGVLPGCVEACPTQALIAGTRRDILDEAKRRIAANPGRYVEHIYGEYEAGGTSHLYLSAVPFDQIGFRQDLGTKPYPEYSSFYLKSVPFVATLTPLLMLAVGAAVKSGRNGLEKREEKHEEKGKH
ncbi:MAG TPA: 4Fe-4S dicluster domain-containing protein [Thermodesulfovibrionales bacterium]|nr:4Fe-4S dicluster domain-containing protein [Thermodesulfovibrionales bacterium]